MGIRVKKDGTIDTLVNPHTEEPSKEWTNPSIKHRTPRKVSEDLRVLGGVPLKGSLIYFLTR